MREVGVSDLSAIGKPVKAGEIQNVDSEDEKFFEEDEPVITRSGGVGRHLLNGGRAQLNDRRVSFSDAVGGQPVETDHNLVEDSSETKKHRVKSTLIQLEKSKQKPVAFSVRTKLGFEGEKYVDHDAPLLSGTKDLNGNLRDYLVTFENRDYLHIIEKYNNDWWIGKVVREGCDFCFIPSPLKVAQLRQQIRDRKRDHRLSATSSLLHGHKKDTDSLHMLDDHMNEDFLGKAAEPDCDIDWKDTGPLVLGKKSTRLRKNEQPYEVVPTMRPVVFVGPSLKGYEVTDMMQKSLFDYLKKKFEGRCNIVRISSDLSLARRNMPRTEENRPICEDYDRIYDLAKNLQLVILDCDMVNNPTQLEKSGLMPIMVFIKISDPEVLKRLIKWRGRSQIRHMGVQCMAAEKLCQCDPNVFDIILDENVFEEACEHLTEYLEAYWNATHPVLPEATHPKELITETEVRSNLPNVLTKLIPRSLMEESKLTKKASFFSDSDDDLIDDRADMS